MNSVIKIVALLLLFNALGACVATSTRMPPSATSTQVSPALSKVRHVFVIVLENEPYAVTFGAHSIAPYLAHQLPKQGALLPNYYGIGHYSLDNYIAVISGQAPNPATQADCGRYVEFARSKPGLDANGQVLGEGCVYPADVKTLADQLDTAGDTWKGYMEDMGADPSRESASCGHATIGTRDHTNHATAKDQYADKHNPFVYFHSIVDDPARCVAHVVNLASLTGDLQRTETTPNFSFITPSLCHDGHDAPCKNGEPGGLISADKFLQTWVPRILASPAFKRDGLLVITFDEGTDGGACCGEQGLPGGPTPGQFGPGGGQIGAVLLSPFIAPGTISYVAYNHYSFLRSVEDAFGLPYLGYAGPRVRLRGLAYPVMAGGPSPQLRSFGTDVFTTTPP